MKLPPLLILSLGLLLVAGCKPKPVEIPTIKRTEAANLASEAQFALSLRDYARAEPLFDKATQLTPDTAEYWVSLGVTRRRQNNKDGARKAYEKAAEAFEAAFEKEPKDTDSLLQQVHMLVLLGKPDDARKVLAKALKAYPENRVLKGFSETKQIDRILADPGLKDVAL